MVCSAQDLKKKNAQLSGGERTKDWGAGMSSYPSALPLLDVSFILRMLCRQLFLAFQCNWS